MKLIKKCLGLASIVSLGLVATACSSNIAAKSSNKVEIDLLDSYYGNVMLTAYIQSSGEITGSRTGYYYSIKTGGFKDVYSLVTGKQIADKVDDSVNVSSQTLAYGYSLAYLNYGNDEFQICDDEGREILAKGTYKNFGYGYEIDEDPSLVDYKKGIYTYRYIFTISYDGDSGREHKHIALKFDTNFHTNTIDRSTISVEEVDDYSFAQTKKGDKFSVICDYDTAGKYSFGYFGDYVAVRNDKGEVLCSFPDNGYYLYANDAIIVQYSKNVSYDYDFIDGSGNKIKCQTFSYSLPSGSCKEIKDYPYYLSDSSFDSVSNEYDSTEVLYYSGSFAEISAGTVNYVQSAIDAKGNIYNADVDQVENNYFYKLDGSHFVGYGQDGYTWLTDSKGEKKFRLSSGSLSLISIESKVIPVGKDGFYGFVDYNGNVIENYKYGSCSKIDKSKYLVTDYNGKTYILEFKKSQLASKTEIANCLGSGLSSFKPTNIEKSGVVYYNGFSVDVVKKETTMDLKITGFKNGEEPFDLEFKDATSFKFISIGNNYKVIEIISADTVCVYTVELLNPLLGN